MGFAHTLPRRFAVVTESSFNSGPDTDYDTDATAVWTIGPDVSSIGQQKVANENIRPRPIAYHASVLGLKSGSSFTFGQYITAKGTNAAEQASASTTQLVENMRCWLGGRRLGYCAGIASASGTTLNVDTGEGANFNQGDWVFLKPTSASDGEFYQVQSVSTDALTLDRTITGAAGADATGTAHAVITVYIDQDALTKNTDANYITRAFLIEGQDAEDAWDLRGVKLQGELTGFNAGEQPRVNFTGLVTSFLHETLTQESIADAPEGEPPLVVGRGDDTSFRIGDFGGALSAVPCFTFEPRAGITWEAQTGPCGQEGVHGYMASGFDDVGLSMQVQFDDNYATDFRAGTLKHALMQIGTTPTAAIGVYFPRLEYSEEPKRVDGPAMTVASSLNFRGLENTASAGSLTGDDLEAWRSPIQILIVA